MNAVIGSRVTDRRRGRRAETSGNDTGKDFEPIAEVTAQPVERVVAH